MKLILYLSIFLSFLACSNYSETKNSEIKLPTDSIVKDTGSDRTELEKEYLAERLEPIREKFRELKYYDQNGWSGIDKRGYGKHISDGHIIYHFLHGELRKLTLVQFDSLKIKRWRTTIYMEDTIPFFAYKREFDSLQFKEDKEWYEPFEDSLFFENGSIFRIKSSGDCGSPYTTDYLLEEESDISNKIKLALEKI